MKVLVILVVLGFLATSAKAGTCSDCLLQKCAPCAVKCIPPTSPGCWMCVLQNCGSCIPPCFGAVTVQEDFGKGMESRDYCVCPTPSVSVNDYSMTNEYSTSQSGVSCFQRDYCLGVSTSSQNPITCCGRDKGQSYKFRTRCYRCEF